MKRQVGSIPSIPPDSQDMDSMLGKIGNLGIGEGILCLDDTARKVRIPKKNEASN